MFARFVALPALVLALVLAVALVDSQKTEAGVSPFVVNSTADTDDATSGTTSA